MFECRINEKQFPEEGEIVMAKTISLDSDILKMKLLEYGNIHGMVLNSELSKRRIRSIHQVARVGNTEVCQVLRIDPEKEHIDLSLKRPSDSERQACLDKFAKNKIAYQIMVKAARSIGCPVIQLYKEFGYEKMGEYGSLYRFFAKARANETLYDELHNGEAIKRIINEQFKASKFKVRIDLDVSAPSGGIEVIKDAFQHALCGEEGLEATLLRTPTYSITYIGPDKAAAINLLNKVSEKLKEFITSHNGICAISAPARVYGEKHKHSLLNEEGAVETEDLLDSDDSGYSA